MIPPPLRALDIRPLPDDPERLLVIDPIELQADAMAVPLAFLVVAQHFDGVRSEDAVAQLLRAEGVDVLPEKVRFVAEQLAAFNLLADARVEAQLRAIEREALATPRPARLAGKCYPKGGPETAAWIDGLMAAEPPVAASGSLAGLVVPHIDPRLGGQTFAHGYRSLLAAPAADVYVVVGIGHAGLRHGLSLAPVDFQTPLGTVPADREICHELKDRLGDWILADQAVQRREHSVEFQAVFLRHLAKGPFTMVPLLAGFGPRDTGRIRPVLETIGSVLRESRKRVLVIASVDFSHVGPMYGDAKAAASMMGSVEDRDRRAIAQLEVADDAGFWDTVHADGNSTRICGYSSMWGMLTLTQARRGLLLDYGQTVMDQEDSRVTFAAMSFPA